MWPKINLKNWKVDTTKYKIGTAKDWRSKIKWFSDDNLEKNKTEIKLYWNNSINFKSNTGYWIYEIN